MKRIHKPQRRGAGNKEALIRRDQAPGSGRPVDVSVMTHIPELGGRQPGSVQLPHEYDDVNCWPMGFNPFRDSWE